MNYTLHTPEGFQKVALPMSDKWLAALRSGEYQQGKEALCEDGKYCCLGVLSKLQGRLTDGGYDADPLYCSGLSVDNPLRQIICEYGEMPRKCSVSIEGVELPKTILSACNDNGLTFLEIADIIEALYEESKEVAQ